MWNYFGKFCNFFEQIGHPVSIASLSRFLKSEGRVPSKETPVNFIDAACEAFTFEKLDFETSTGKQMLAFNHKFYATDHGLRHALFLSHLLNIDQILENIVAIELRRRGWKVSTGRVPSLQNPSKELEVDFIAQKNNQTLYVQVAYLLASLETDNREFGALLSSPDNFPKLAISLNSRLSPRNALNIKGFSNGFCQIAEKKRTDTHISVSPASVIFKRNL